jgi:hypothetical protein
VSAVDKELHASLIKYLKCKILEGDWHAVSDAANDLRVLEERMRKIKRRV